ncbi:VWA domain-containing protein [Nonomuraea sp. NPDC050404]|uniref:VWA domain-containing protein n=1 Tax=Nonomuraea sp. NPDC050404 TaxID=3155783 RepID=UPI0033CB6043
MNRYVRTLIACLTLLAVLTSCTQGDEDVTLRVLASPELVDVEPLLSQLKDDTGVKLDVDYRAEADLSGARSLSYDLAWPASDRSFLLRLQESGEQMTRPESTPIMRSPVVVGLTREVADTLRAKTPSERLSWADIADAATDGTIRFGIADPHSNETGRAALVGVATAAARTGSALREQDVSCNWMRGFRSGQTLTGASSPELIATYTGHQSEANALIAHESDLLSLNANKLREPLQIVYPEDGMVLSDFPLLLLDPSERTAYRKVTDWLLQADVQRKLMQSTWRRPVNQDVTPAGPLRSAIGNALSYPDRLSIVKRLIADYGDPASTPDQVVFLLDFSGSMRGAQIAGLRTAFAGLSGADPMSTGKFARFYRGEQITVIRFGHRVLQERTVTVRDDGDLRALRKVAAADSFDDSTAIWSALERGYRIAAAAVRKAPEQPVSIVLMTDGENNAGISYEEFLRRHRELGADARKVRTFPVHFGDADAVALEKAADATGGRMVDADLSSLSDAFKEIRGCH